MVLSFSWTCFPIPYASVHVVRQLDILGLFVFDILTCFVAFPFEPQVVSIGECVGVHDLHESVKSGLVTVPMCSLFGKTC